MKNKISLSLLSLFVLPISANADITYRVEQVEVFDGSSESHNDTEAFARKHRFYLGGTYSFSMWNDGADDAVSIKGKNTSGFDAVAGVRLYDIFRLEADYAYNLAKWNEFEMKSNMAMVNAIFDARIDSLYRLFYKQRLVPYVGIGAGLSWNSVEDVSIENKISPVASVMAGVGVELGEYFTLDFGYRYLYMFSPEFSVINDFAPIAHQFRVGARINF